MSSEISDSPHAPAEILLIEDNPADAALTTEALAQASRHCTLHVARSGEAALEFLRGGDDARPDLILLDPNLPGMSGLEVLRALKGDERLRQIPVVVLSTSASQPDVDAAYDLGANAYILKPESFSEYHEVMKVLDLYWFSVVTRPRRRSA